MIEKEIIISVVATLAANYIISSMKQEDQGFKTKKEMMLNGN